MSELGDLTRQPNIKRKKDISTGEFCFTLGTVILLVYILVSTR